MYAKIAKEKAQESRKKFHGNQYTKKSGMFLENKNIPNLTISTPQAPAPSSSKPASEPQEEQKKPHSKLL
jgi:hypothetical protein